MGHRAVLHGASTRIMLDRPVPQIFRNRDRMVFSPREFLYDW